jgi:hypothetical protein
MNMTKPILLVEGKDDQHVFYALLEHYSVPETFKVEEMGGIEPLLESLAVRLKLVDLKCLGIVVDADLDLEKRWSSIIGILKNAGYVDLPASPIPEGTIISPAQNTLPRIGIWIMPDNRLPGLLENFIRFLVPVGNPLLAHACSCVAAIPPAQRNFSEVDRPKAEIHTWLAWQESPGLPLGTAITAKYLKAEAECAQVLMSWIRRLFSY